ncbi:hypothetical protein [Aliiroseovarius halocynthiae]|uniref:Uncharacterized protein n=1 Tax=Aliiroseovarius halocynthiae TaxID=985055 RepID=A0A545SKW8_9RHOB|nr:hypothetical protein [Aliiroseovarius halocynthiae]TQV65630.1 hypothetical protein FIL88_16370 [Aliiroseovarius halocynthiae]
MAVALSMSGGNILRVILMINQRIFFRTPFETRQFRKFLRQIATFKQLSSTQCRLDQESTQDAANAK